MPSNALRKFQLTINRCERLVEHFDQQVEFNAQVPVLPGMQRPIANKDIIRGAVVLGVSALDAYATDVFSEKLTQYLRNYTPDNSLIELLHSAGVDTREALNLINMDRPYRRINTLIRRYYNRHTTQNFSVIDDLFSHYRLPRLTTDAAARINRPSYRGSVEKLVQRRHEIAHSGDYNSHNRLKEIDQGLISRRLVHLHALVESMDVIVCNRV